MTNKISIFSFPTRIVFGPGAVRELGNEAKQLGITRPLVVTDRGVVWVWAGGTDSGGVATGWSRPRHSLKM